MQPVDPRVVELFNDALTLELTVTNTYFLHARMLENWGLPRLGKVFYDLSIDEMRDADDLINRVLMFDGHPNVQKLNAITVGETAEEMLRLGGILLPSTPFEVPVNTALPIRRVAAWGNEVTDPNRRGKKPKFDGGQVLQYVIDYSIGLSNTITTVRHALGDVQEGVGTMVQGMGVPEAGDTSDAPPMRMPIR